VGHAFCVPVALTGSPDDVCREAQHLSLHLSSGARASLSRSAVGAPHVSPARKGWEKVASEIPSAVGAIPSPPSGHCKPL